MNTRGIIQLVVLNIGVELKILSPVIFAMFVLMATILTFATSPILYILYRRKYNPEESHNGHDLHMTLEEDNSLNSHKDFPTVLTDEFNLSLPVGKSNNFVEMNGIRKSLHRSMDDLLSSSRTNPNGELSQSNRHCRMTLF